MLLAMSLSSRCVAYPPNKMVGVPAPLYFSGKIERFIYRRKHPRTSDAISAYFNHQNLFAVSSALFMKNLPTVGPLNLFDLAYYAQCYSFISLPPYCYVSPFIGT